MNKSIFYVESEYAYCVVRCRCDEDEIRALAEEYVLSNEINIQFLGTCPPDAPTDVVCAGGLSL